MENMEGVNKEVILACLREWQKLGLEREELEKRRRQAEEEASALSDQIREVERRLKKLRDEMAAALPDRDLVLCVGQKALVLGVYSGEKDKVQKCLDIVPCEVIQDVGQGPHIEEVEP